MRLILLTETRAMEWVLESVVQGNSAQIQDAAFVSELKSWIRFSRGDAVRTGDGLFAGASGNPVSPSWLGGLLFGMFFTEKQENDKYAKQVRSSAGIAVFTAATSDKAHWVNVGRSYERFALQATAVGIRTAMLNQPVEVAAVGPQLAASLGLGRTGANETHRLPASRAARWRARVRRARITVLRPATAAEWNTLFYNYLDHHLTQFGV